MRIHASPQERHFIGEINEMVLRSHYQSGGLTLASVDEPKQCLAVYAADIDIHIQRMRVIMDRCYQIQPPHQACGVISNEALFEALRLQWHKERGITSSIDEMVLCKAYQSIIGLGKTVAVPLIVRQLEREGNKPDHWFWALEALTLANPVPGDCEGNMQKMAQAWLEWARG